jgi:hypothetical protein
MSKTIKKSMSSVKAKIPSKLLERKYLKNNLQFKKMDAKKDKKIMLAVQFKLLADESTHSLSVKSAMELAGFDEAEINSSTIEQRKMQFTEHIMRLKKNSPYL